MTTGCMNELTMTTGCMNDYGAYECMANTATIIPLLRLKWKNWLV